MKKNKDGKTLQEVLDENREKMWERHLKEKKKQEKEIIIGMFLIGAILVGIFYLGYLQNSKAMEKCTQNHDYDYCLVNLWGEIWK